MNRVYFIAILLIFSVINVMAQDSDTLKVQISDKTEEKNRNVMLNATTQSKPREISIGLPGSDSGTLIFEDGLPVCFSSWPVYYYFRWAGGNSYESQGLMKIGETSIRSSEVGYAINSRSKLGGDDFSGAVSLGTSQYGLIRLDANVSGPMGRGWYYSIGAYANYDPSSVKQETRFFVNQSQIYKAAITKRWNDGRTSLSLLYKYAMNNDGTYGYNTAPFYYNGDGSISVFDGFRMGRDSYFPNDDLVEYMDLETGQMVKRNLSDMNRKNLHDATVLFSHTLGNDWNMTWNTRLATTEGMDNLGIYEAGTFMSEKGLTQQRMALLCHSDATDLLSTVEFTKKTEKHSWRFGLNEWNSWQKEAASTFNFAHLVGVNPDRVYKEGKNTWNHNLCAEYYDGWENKSVLYATDDWMITPRLNIYYGLRLELQSLSVESANNVDGNTGNTRVDGYNLMSGQATLNRTKKTWLNPIGMIQIYYQLGKHFHLTGEYSYTTQHPGAVYFKYAELPVLKPMITNLGRAGIIFNSKMINITSLISIINKSGNNGAGHFTKEINGVYETQTGSSFYDIRTLGWTTDVNFTWKGFNLHALATLQNPCYHDFKNNVKFSDGSVETFDYSDKYVSGVSRVLLEIDPSYSWEKWKVWASCRYYSRQYANKLNNVWFNGHWETFAGVQFSHKGMTYSLNAINLLNQTGANGTIDVADTITDNSLLQGYLTAGTFIRPFTVELSVKIDF